MNRRTALYRLYDEAEVLLYVGIAVNPAARWAVHSGEKSWWPEVARKSVEWFDARPQAEAAEAIAVVAELPRYNVTHSTTRVRGDAKAEYCGKSTPLRQIRVPDDEWEAFGASVGNPERTRVLREFMRWYLRWPGASHPEPPPEPRKQSSRQTRTRADKQNGPGR